MKRKIVEAWYKMSLMQKVAVLIFGVLILGFSIYVFKEIITVLVGLGIFYLFIRNKDAPSIDLPTMLAAHNYVINSLFKEKLMMFNAEYFLAELTEYQLDEPSIVKSYYYSHNPKRLLHYCVSLPTKGYEEVLETIAAFPEDYLLYRSRQFLYEFMGKRNWSAQIEIGDLSVVHRGGNIMWELIMTSPDEARIITQKKLEDIARYDSQSSSIKDDDFSD